MSQASLVTPVAKLDIKDLLSPSPSPPPPQPVQPLLTSRSISVPPPCSQCNPTPSPSITSTTSHYTASPAQLTTCNTFAQRQNSPLKQPAGFSGAKQFALLQNPELDVTAETVVSGKRPHPTDEEHICSPAKKSSKWSSAENAKVIRLRSKGVKWNDVSKQMLGRSMTACRLHFQNYLERREPWDEEKKNKLARVYERLKYDVWNPIAIELGVPWRAAEAMHWYIGEQDMARRANVTPFSIAAARPEAQKPSTGRVAQRDRMLESTRIFEGRDLGTLSSPYPGLHGNGHRHSLTATGSTYGIPPSPHLHIAPIKMEQSLEGDDSEGIDDEEEGSDEGSGVRKRRSGMGTTKLPGMAQLDGEVQALAERERSGMAATDMYGERRSSGGSSGSHGSFEMVKTDEGMS